MSDPTQHPTNSGETGGQSVHQTSLGQLLWCPTDQLQPHPAFLRNQFAPSPEEISRLVGKDDSAFEEPLLITQDFLIVSGYTQWRVARRLKRNTVPCLQRTMTEEEAVLALLESNQSRSGLNAYCLILIALELEPSLTERAWTNQRIGGKLKGSSDFTEADRVDVREKIANVANSCTANVSKVKYIQTKAIPELHVALRTGEIRINRAWKWSKTNADEQRASLKALRGERGFRQDIRKLLAKRRPETSLVGEGLRHLLSAMTMLKRELTTTQFASALEEMHESLLLQRQSDCDYADAA